MLKDFMHALFKEDVDEEDIEEEVTEKEPEKRVITQTEYEEIKEQVPVKEPALEPVYAQTEYIQEQAETVTPHKSIFAGLDMEEVSRPVPGEKKSAYKFDRSRLKNKKAQTVEDYQAVISPIFGNVEDDKKEYDKIHDAVSLPKPDESFAMTKVISPMFGNDLPEPKPASSIPPYKRRAEAKPAAVKDLLDTNQPETVDQPALVKEGTR